MTVLAPTFVRADIITYGFTGTVDRIAYSDCISYRDSGSCDDWDITNPDVSSFYEGREFNLNTTYSGQFSFNTNEDYSLSQDGFQAVYLDAIVGYSISIGGNTFPDSVLPLASEGSLSIVDGRNGVDSFFVSQWLSGIDWFASTYISLQDRTNQVYDDFTMPNRVDLTDFQYAGFHFGFLRRSDGDQLHLNGSLTSLNFISDSSTSVNAPTSISLFFIALLCLLYKKSVRLSGH